jgi:hypothetical protein
MSVTCHVKTRTGPKAWCIAEKYVAAAMPAGRQMKIAGSQPSRQPTDRTAALSASRLVVLRKFRRHDVLEAR